MEQSESTLGGGNPPLPDDGGSSGDPPDDLDAGPSNLDCIEDGLWLGNLTAAMNLDILEKIRCTHILTVDSCPLPKTITMLPIINWKFIQGVFPGTNLLQNYSYFGVSRSSTIVIAYIMKKYQIGFDEAFERVKSKRKFACPNQGFEAQLKLFEKMDFTIDRQCLHYRLYKLKVAAVQVAQARILPIEHMDVVKPDPALMTVKPNPLVYRCSKCRRIVASVSNLLPHVPGRRMSWKKRDKSESPDYCRQIYFVEPLAWMKAVLNSEEGKLNCPSCNSKLGSFSWTMGIQCSCGSKIAPAFYLVPSKVEYSNIVKNIQITV